ncbi:MAG: class I SAM-dependent methyltransferase [Thermoguttaceae bacterium]|nr:class I SAM-dependent methyltransferase [Thermoguttaceae bacterium]MDW8079040.1 class I SAM-dependent methyltransferase [Thermoguttaceae bacterium]
MCPSVSFEAELAAIRARYARRRDGFAHQARSLLDPERLFRFQERERAVLRFLRRRAPKPLWELRILEIGCGYGGNLLQFARWGCRPENLYANELLEDRLEIARELLPRGVHLLPGDAAALDLEPGSFDIVLQSTVFSSILDPAFRHVLASKMWTWLAPGGAILWYDLRYPNPWNPDVVPIPLGEIRRLFPAGCVYKRSITPMPPVARVVARFGPLPYMLLSAIRPLRTHWLCWIEKQKCDDTGRA